MQVNERPKPLADNLDIRELIEQLYPCIHRAALAITRNPCEADDLAQETMLQVLQSWSKFSGRSRASTWVYAILINIHRRQLRGRNRFWRRLQDWFARRDTPPQACDPADTVEDSESRHDVWRLVARLPVTQRHVVVLRYGEELSYDDIAEVLECPLGTVKSRLHQALAALKQMMESESSRTEARSVTPTVPR